MSPFIPNSKIFKLSIKRKRRQNSFKTCTQNLHTNLSSRGRIYKISTKGKYGRVKCVIWPKLKFN